ncbi:MAG: hypothetical protein H6935_05235 [Thiobacillus sp.]|nr:hypothetical protein [Thiobacillus sp.]
MQGPPTLLVIGVHREELAFGEQVAAGLDPGETAVLRIGEGLSGRRPRPDELFHYDTLHRELYHQLLAHVRKRAYRLVIDLHTGIDRDGPCADIYCKDAALSGCVEMALRYADPAWGRRSRVVPFAPTSGQTPFATCVIPEQVCNSPQFLYVGLEIFLPEHRAAQAEDWNYARGLVRLLAGCVG